jgi:hypothetical protein
VLRTRQLLPTNGENIDEALLRQAHISALSRSSSRVLSAFRSYLKGTGHKIPGFDAIPIMGGKAQNMLDNADDLVALRKPADNGFLSRFLRDYWIFQKRNSVDPLDHITFYKSRHVTLDSNANQHCIRCNPLDCFHRLPLCGKQSEC